MLLAVRQMFKVSIWSFVGAGFVYAAAAPLTDEKTLENCNLKHPIFVTANVLTTDADWVDPVKTSLRRDSIDKEMSRDPEGVRSCLESFVADAKLEYDNDADRRAAIQRLSEITSAVARASNNAAKTIK